MLKAFGGSDAIDITDIMSASFRQLSYTGNATSGALVVTDGTHTASMTLIGNYTSASFILGSDGHGGTLITHRDGPS